MQRHISTLIRRRAVLVNFAVQHGDLARGIAHDDGIMGGGNNGHTLLLIELLQHFQAILPMWFWNLGSLWAHQQVTTPASVTIARAMATRCC